MKKLLTAAGAATIAASMSAGTAKAATELTLVYPFPDFLVYTKLCKDLAARITKAGLKIKVLPFNSIKMFQQAPAVRKGRVDISCTPSAFWARAVPENEAISISSQTPEMARQNGGTAIIDQINQKYFNVKYLGWTSPGGRFRIYMKSPPKFKNGMLDLAGVKMRDNPIYGAFFRALKAKTHPMRATQVYAALEKGVVDASAWATIGLKGLKWDKFLRHAVEPEFYSTDIAWIINLDKWKSLTIKEKHILQSQVIMAETRHRVILQGLAKKERATLIKEGMKFYNVPNAKTYSKLALSSATARMLGRLKKAGRPTDHVQTLIDLYQK